MGTATILQNVNAVVDELSLPTLVSLVGSTDDQARQLLALANREGKATSAMVFGAGMGWQAMRALNTITLVDGTESYALPSDWDHATDQTWWDVAYKWQLAGPMTPQEWDVLKYGIAPAGPRRRFRIFNNAIYINPIPSAADAGLTVVNEYYSNKWCQSAGAVKQAAFLADTDTYLLDDDTMQLGIKWRFLRAKGFDYTEEKAQWFAEVMQAMAKDQATRYLPTNAQARDEAMLLSSNQVPDTGFGT